MPKKVKLKLDDLNIESFKTSDKPVLGGEVTRWPHECVTQTTCQKTFCEDMPEYECVIKVYGDI